MRLAFFYLFGDFYAMFIDIPGDSSQKSIIKLYILGPIFYPVVFPFSDIETYPETKFRHKCAETGLWLVSIFIY